MAGWLVGWEWSVDGQNGAKLDLTKKWWICDNFMKEIVLFLEGFLEEVWAVFWLAAAAWLAGWQAADAQGAAGQSRNVRNDTLAKTYVFLVF